MPHQSTPSSARPRTGFSLIELLVVIAIVAILIALLFPFIRSSIERGRETSCLGNLKNWGVGISMFQTSGAKYFPTEGQGSSALITQTTAWFNVLPPIFDEIALKDYAAQSLPLPRPGMRTIFNCPSVPASAAAKTPANQPYFSYAQNLYIEDDNRASNQTAGRNLPFTAVDTPSLFVYLAEVNGAQFANVDGRFVVYRHGESRPKNAPTGVMGKRSRANFVFMDGSAKAHTWQEIYVPARSQNKSVVWDPSADLIN